jgi:selenocysteine-specific translation elongation factor
MEVLTLPLVGSPASQKHRRTPLAAEKLLGGTHEVSGHDFKACPERQSKGADEQSFVSGRGFNRADKQSFVSGRGFNRAETRTKKEGASAPALDHPLASKPTIVVATKIDAVNPAKLKKLAAYAKRRKLEFHAISAVTGQGIDELKWALAKRVRPEKS